MKRHAVLTKALLERHVMGILVLFFGIGFPPFLGGPLRYIDNIGAQSLVAQLTQWSTQHGERYDPCEALVIMAENGTRYY